MVVSVQTSVLGVTSCDGLVQINKKCNVFPKSDQHQTYTRYRHRRNADVVKIPVSWLTEFSRYSHKLRTEPSILKLVVGIMVANNYIN